MKKKIKICLVVAILITLLGSIAFLIARNNDVQSEDYARISNVIEDIDTDTIMELWEENLIGTLQIPSIGVELVVAHGIDYDTLERFVGHFPCTPLFVGNVGLAGHNDSRFFVDLHRVEVGDEIIYTFLTGTRTYIVETIVEIYETDWSYLENTEDNRLTIITCVAGRPEIRLCVQAVEKI